MGSTIAVFTLLFAAAATGWNIFSGYTGYLSLGHAAYYGLGAYVFALLCQLWNVPGGWLALQARRYRFLLLTIVLFAFSAQVPTLLDGTPLGGAEVSLPIPPWGAATFNAPFYYVALTLLAVALVLSWWMRRSQYGLVLLALFGGAGTPLGPALGVLVLVPVQQTLMVQFGEQGWDLILYGAVFLLVLLVLPGVCCQPCRRTCPCGPGWSTPAGGLFARYEP